MSSFVYEAARDANVVSSLQGDYAHCHWIVRERLERFVGEDDLGGQAGSNNLHGVSSVPNGPTLGP